MSNTVEGPRDRGPQGMSAWHRVIAEDGSTIAYAPDIVTANKIAVVDELYGVCKHTLSIFISTWYEIKGDKTITRMAFFKDAMNAIVDLKNALAEVDGKEVER